LSFPARLAFIANLEAHPAPSKEGPARIRQTTAWRKMDHRAARLSL